MIIEKTWTVDVFLTEGEGLTRAEAVLHCGTDRELRGAGHARRNPDDREIPAIGDEVAASRALADLARALRSTAAGDIEDVTGAHAHVHP
ncbi:MULTISPECIES: DUF1876 domain-containing protein [unclassified Pseudofrankia]|uniref:DUF1876 domain-containing protein n=1 Tax=unclassified Pseudofrankia TaxID=2994372 RepID=UPI0008D9B632|nr:MULTISPECIES: DUF1876 domain-containing protein [unclassified Pseudofrankia]MDT3446689.1 DUF1876 domain-containing protein [Pseudofrankia sp. BMG5.37]OHV57562.1 hypothetical protein BCD48_42955 [Pseudofrankia sp. BMG5.36]